MIDVANKKGHKEIVSMLEDKLGQVYFYVLLRLHHITIINIIINHALLQAPAPPSIFERLYEWLMSRLRDMIATIESYAKVFLSIAADKPRDGVHKSLYS